MKVILEFKDGEKVSFDSLTSNKLSNDSLKKLVVESLNSTTFPNAVLGNEDVIIQSTDGLKSITILEK